MTADGSAEGWLIRLLKGDLSAWDSCECTSTGLSWGLSIGLLPVSGSYSVAVDGFASSGLVLATAFFWKSPPGVGVALKRVALPSPIGPKRLP